MNRSKHFPSPVTTMLARRVKPGNEDAYALHLSFTLRAPLRAAEVQTIFDTEEVLVDTGSL